MGTTSSLDPLAAMDTSCRLPADHRTAAWDLLLSVALVFKGLVPKSHISTHLGSELWDRVSALCMRDILNFL